MAEMVNPKNFTATTEIDGTETVPVYDGGWRKSTLNTIKTWLESVFAAKSLEHTHDNKTALDDYNPLDFDPAGEGQAAVAAHLMELNPHTQYLTADELPSAVTTLPPSDGQIYVMRNQQWEVLEIV